MNPNRAEDDVEEDDARKAAKLLFAAGIEPGNVVLEMEAGGGYFTELLSHAVSIQGRVHVQNPAKLDAFFGDELTQRIEDRSLKNVQVNTGDFDEITLPDQSADIVTWIQGPHELWFAPSPGVTLGSPVATFQQIHRVLKPGGALLIADHRAPESSGIVAGGELHRIDPAIIRELAESAGFVLEREFNFLVRQTDQLTLPSFDGRVRGKTSQFVHLYRKAKATEAGL